MSPKPKPNKGRKGGESAITEPKKWRTSVAAEWYSSSGCKSVFEQIAQSHRGVFVVHDRNRTEFGVERVSRDQPRCSSFVDHSAQSKRMEIDYRCFRVKKLEGSVIMKNIKKFRELTYLTPKISAREFKFQY